MSDIQLLTKIVGSGDLAARLLNRFGGLRELLHAEAEPRDARVAQQLQLGLRDAARRATLRGSAPRCATLCRVAPRCEAWRCVARRGATLRQIVKR